MNLLFSEWAFHWSVTSLLFVLRYVSFVNVVVSARYGALLPVLGPGGSLDISLGVLRAWVSALDRVSEADSALHSGDFVAMVALIFHMFYM